MHDVINILNAEPSGYSNEARQILQTIGCLHEQTLSRLELLRCIKDFDVLIVRLGIQVDRELMEAGPRLRVIATPTTGLDHVDVSYARQRQIAVVSLAGETEFLNSIPATAEHTWALLLALVRHIPQAFAAVCDGQWNRDAFRGSELRGKQLGLIGFGRIGQQVARFGLVFGLYVSAYDPHVRDMTPDVQKIRSLADLLRQSDIVSLHVPLLSETIHLINEDAIFTMKRHAFLLNTSRAGVVDEQALLRGLQSGHLGGAALDVLVNEREAVSLHQQPLIRYAREHANLLITPHLGGATQESMHRTELFLAQKVRCYLEHNNQWISPGVACT